MLPLHTLVAKATAIGATFRLAGANVALAGIPLSEDLLAALRERRGELWAHLGGHTLDQPSIELAANLGIEPVLIADPAGVPAALAAIGDGQIGIDIETMPLPQYVAQAKRPLIMNRNGRVATNQTSSADIGLDPHRATIATLQLYSGGLQCFVFRATAITPQLRQHVLGSVCIIHNAAFELAFMQRHWGAIPRKFHCTMQAAGLLLGVQRRALTDAARNYLDVEVTKELQLSDWSAVELSPGQVAYAAADAVLAYRLWPRMKIDLEEEGRNPAYRLQRDAIPAVVDMQLRGLGFDQREHARQVEIWSRELANARRVFTGHGHHAADKAKRGPDMVENSRRY